jgi:hypothetical protein
MSYFDDWGEKFTILPKMVPNKTANNLEEWFQTLGDKSQVEILDIKKVVRKFYI